MSAESLTVSPGLASSRLTLSTVRTLRYALGSTLAIAVAMGIDWRLSYLTPVLTLTFLGAARPPLKALLSFLVVVTLACGLGVLSASVLLPYPGVFLLLEALTLYLLFYHGARGASPLVITWLMIAFTVIPMVALQSMALAVAVAQGIVTGTAAALVVAWIAHILIPDTLATVPAPVASKSESAPGPPSNTEAHFRALRSLLVVFPVVAFYLIMGLTSVLIVVFIALLCMQPSIATGTKAGKALIVANLMGGLAAIAIYEVLVMMPQFGFLLLLTLLGGLIFGRELFSGKATAPLFGMAFSTLLLIIGSTTSMFGDADAKAWTRVIQITTAVVYLVGAHRILARLMRRPETTHAR